MAALRSWLMGGVLGLGLSCVSGCLVGRATHNVSFEARSALENCLEERRNLRWADEAWQQACLEHGWDPGPGDYGEGFRAGFAAHLYRGTLEPPALPPLRYRSFGYENPQGNQALQEWLAGYRHGIAAAVEGGTRRFVTGSVGAGQSSHGEPSIELVSPTFVPGPQGPPQHPEMPSMLPPPVQEELLPAPTRGVTVPPPFAPTPELPGPVSTTKQEPEGFEQTFVTVPSSSTPR